MRRVTTRPGHAPVTGPGCLVRPVCWSIWHHLPAGIRRYHDSSIVSVAQGHDDIFVWGNLPYGGPQLEQTGTPATVLLLAGFVAACLVQLAGGCLLIWLRPAGFVVMPAGMLLSAVLWWGFDLPLAWLNAATVLPVLAAAEPVGGCCRWRRSRSLAGRLFWFGPVWRASRVGGLAAGDDRAEVADCRDVGRRVAVDEEQVGVEPGPQPARAVRQAAGAGGEPGSRCERGRRGNAGHGELDDRERERAVCLERMDARVGAAD
jgi:hypothetical protein